VRHCGGRAGRPFHLDFSPQPESVVGRFATGLWLVIGSSDAGRVVGCSRAARAVSDVLPSNLFAPDRCDVDMPSGDALPGRADPESSGSSRTSASRCSGCCDIRSTEPNGGSLRTQVPGCSHLVCTHVFQIHACRKFCMSFTPAMPCRHELPGDCRIRLAVHRSPAQRRHRAARPALRCGCR